MWGVWRCVREKLIQLLIRREQNTFSLVLQGVAKALRAENGEEYLRQGTEYGVI